MNTTITIDGKTVPFADGQTIMDAALASGIYIPHLCHNPDFEPHGSCKLCVVSVNGRNMTSCTMPAAEGMAVASDTPELNEDRKALVQMLFVEGNHICPACEASGNCQLQATAYYLNMLSPHFTHFYAPREVDASHPDIFLDLNRCILCELCVRASREIDVESRLECKVLQVLFVSSGEFFQHVQHRIRCRMSQPTVTHGSHDMAKMLQLFHIGSRSMAHGDFIHDFFLQLGPHAAWGTKATAFMGKEMCEILHHS